MKCVYSATGEYKCIKPNTIENFASNYFDNAEGTHIGNCTNYNFSSDKKSLTATCKKWDPSENKWAVQPSVTSTVNLTNCYKLDILKEGDDNGKLKCTETIKTSVEPTPSSCGPDFFNRRCPTTQCCSKSAICGGNNSKYDQTYCYQTRNDDKFRGSYNGNYDGN